MKSCTAKYASSYSFNFTGKTIFSFNEYILKGQIKQPFQEVAGDFCSYSTQHYLVLVDCYPNWPDIIPMGHDTTAPPTSSRWSDSHSAVQVFWFDEGPQFTSKKFREFAAQWCFTHITSTPRYPQSNGKIETTVKSMNKIIRSSWNSRHLDEDKLCCALLQY